MDNKTRKLMFSSENPEWGTPQDLYDKLDKEHKFTVDLCANEKNHKHKFYITTEENFLTLKIEGIGFLNPPYNKPEKPCKSKCIKETCKKRGWHRITYFPGQIDFVAHSVALAKAGFLTTVALLPARTDTKIFHQFIWNKIDKKLRDGVELDFLEGRLKFEDENGKTSDPAPFPSMIVVFHSKI